MNSPIATDHDKPLIGRNTLLVPNKVAQAEKTREGRHKYLIYVQEKYLSRRHEEVLELLLEGHTNKSVARNLNISVKTVEKHRQHIYKVCDVDNTVALLRYAILTWNYTFTEVCSKRPS